LGSSLFSADAQAANLFYQAWTPKPKFAHRIVNNLGINMLQAAEHTQPRRSPLPTTVLRTRSWRAMRDSRLVSELAIIASLAASLTGLASDNFASVGNTLTLVRFRFARGAKLRGNFTD
jgi:hypothetical protein